MASSVKKARYDTDIFKVFSEDKSKFEHLKTVVEQLCLTLAGSLASVTILQCNAAYGLYGKPGKPFSSADVDVEVNSKRTDTVYSFGKVFEKGFDVLCDYLNNPSNIPKDSCMQLVLSKLLTFLTNKEDQEALKSVDSCEKILECDLAVRFAQHLFSKLGTSSSFTLDQFYHSRTLVTSCNCGCRAYVNDRFGDTSIGNPKIWHGCIDVILDSCNIPVAVIDDEKDQDSPGGKTSIEVKTKDDLEDNDTTSQLIAQTIVFSFTQKKNHPEFEHFLFPNIGIGKNSVIFYFYDSENDILLKSPAFPIFNDGELETISILAVWFVVNYKYLCSGVTTEMKNKSPKADFFKHADKQLDIYQSGVSFGGVPKEKLSVNTYKPWFHGCKLGEKPKKYINKKEDNKA